MAKKDARRRRSVVSRTLPLDSRGGDQRRSIELKAGLKGVDRSEVNISFTSIPSFTLQQNMGDGGYSPSGHIWPLGYSLKNAENALQSISQIVCFISLRTLRAEADTGLR